MNGNYNIIDYENQEYQGVDTLASLRFTPRTLESMNHLGSLVFNTLLNLESGENAIQDILAKYQKEKTIEHFHDLLDSLLNNADILNYSNEEWYVFYTTMCAKTSLAEYITLFKKGVFSQSFVAQMYSFSAPAFAHLSEIKKKSYSQLQKKYAPIDLNQLAIATQIFDKLIEVQKGGLEVRFTSPNLN